MTQEEFVAAQKSAQGYILRGHKRSHIWCALLRFKPKADPGVLRQRLQDLAGKVTSKDEITQYKDDPEYIVRGIGLTWPGYQILKLDQHPERFSPEFQQGFAVRAETITRRPADAGWDHSNGTRTPVTTPS